MGSQWIIVSVLCLSAWESTAITNKLRPLQQEGNLRNFRHISGSSGSLTTDWELGLREAVNQALLRERYHEFDLRDRLLQAPLIGRRDTATPFGDIVTLAKGQLYKGGGNFLFVQDQQQDDCYQCSRCSRSQCQIWQPSGEEQLVALWVVKRLRHRSYNGIYYELEYTVSPITPAINDFVRCNGYFDYTIPGHIFVVRNDKVTPDQAELHSTFVENKHAPYHHRFKPEILIGISPDGQRHVLQSYPGFYTSFPIHPTYHQNGYSTNDPKEIALYKQLVESLAAKTSTTQKVETGPHRFSLNGYTDSTTNEVTNIPKYDTLSATKTTMVQLPSGQFMPLTKITTPMSTVSTVPSTTTTMFITTQFKPGINDKPLVLNMLPTKPTELNDYPKTTYSNSGQTPQSTQPIKTTLHFFTPVGEEELITGGITEMKKIMLDTTTIKKPTYTQPQKAEESGLDFLFPGFGATLPSKPMKNTQPSTVSQDGFSFLEEPISSQTSTTQNQHSINKFKLNTTPMAVTSSTNIVTTEVTTPFTPDEDSVTVKVRTTASEPTKIKPKTTATFSTNKYTTPGITNTKSMTTKNRISPTTTSKTVYTTTTSEKPTTGTISSKADEELTTTKRTTIIKTSTVMPSTSRITLKQLQTTASTKIESDLMTTRGKVIKTTPVIPSTTKTTAKQLQTTTPIKTESKLTTTRRRIIKTTTVMPSTTKKLIGQMQTTASKTENEFTTIRRKIIKTTVIPSKRPQTSSTTTEKTAELPSSTTKMTTTALEPTKTKQSNLTGFISTVFNKTKVNKISTYKPKPFVFAVPKQTSTSEPSVAETSQRSPTVPTTFKVTQRQKESDLDYTLLEDISPTEPMNTVTLKPYKTTPSSTTTQTYSTAPTTQNMKIIDNVPTTEVGKTTGITILSPTAKFKVTEDYGMVTEPSQASTMIQEQSTGKKTDTTVGTTRITDTTNYDATQLSFNTTAITNTLTSTIPTYFNTETTSTMTSESPNTTLQQTGPNTTATTMTSKITQAAIDDFLGNGNNDKPILTKPANKDFDEDDIFGTARQENKPSQNPVINKVTESDIALELFGSDEDSQTIQTVTTAVPKGTKIIFSNFFQASTSPLPPTTELVTQTETYATTMDYVPLTKQSFATSISLEVNNINNESSTEIESTTTSTESTTVALTRNSSREETKNTTTAASSQEMKKAFDRIALQVINHAKSIDILNENSNRTRRAKYKRRKTYISKNKRTNNRRNT